MFCSAMAKPNVAAEMPSSSVIGRMKSPRLWRSPMQIEMTRPLATSSTSIPRRSVGKVMASERLAVRSRPSRRANLRRGGSGGQ